LGMQSAYTAKARKANSTCGLLNETESTISYQLSSLRHYPHFRFPKRNCAQRRQLLLVKLLGSPALSDERAAPLKMSIEQNRGERRTTWF
jgi:hypothetical protein